MELSKKYKVFYISSFMDNDNEYGITQDGEFKSLDAYILLSISNYLFPSEEEAERYLLAFGSPSYGRQYVILPVYTIIY